MFLCRQKLIGLMTKSKRQPWIAESAPPPRARFKDVKTQTDIETYIETLHTDMLIAILCTHV